MGQGLLECSTPCLAHGLGGARCAARTGRSARPWAWRFYTLPSREVAPVLLSAASAMSVGCRLAGEWRCMAAVLAAGSQHRKPNVNKAAHLRGLRVREDVRRDPTMGASSEKERPEAESVPIPREKGLWRRKGVDISSVPRGRWQPPSPPAGAPLAQWQAQGWCQVVCEGRQPLAVANTYAVRSRKAVAWDVRPPRHASLKTPLAVICVSAGILAALLVMS